MVDANYPPRFFDCNSDLIDFSLIETTENKYVSLI